MSKYLMARVIEGTDNWFEYKVKHMPDGICSSFLPIPNEVIAVIAPCDQQGYDTLYNMGKDLWENGKCSKYEIAAFDNDNLFWKCRPDKWNFTQCRYNGWFESMIEEELKSFHSEDFQNDQLETSYVLDYQAKFWDNKTTRFSPGSFERLVNDTNLYEDLASVRQWFNSNVNLKSEELIRDCGFKYKGQFIINPFYDETLRFEVEPISYYGKENIEKYILKAKELIVKEEERPQHSHITINNTHSLDELISHAEVISDRPHTPPELHPKQKEHSGIEK